MLTPFTSSVTLACKQRKHCGLGMAPMLGMQLLNDALLTVAFTVGLAIALSIGVLAWAALWRRHEYRAGVREIEQHLAAAVTEDSPATG
jgi:hypothetical protein